MMYQPQPGLQPYRTVSSPHPDYWPDNPVHITCPYCGQQGNTHVERVTGTVTWIWFIFCLLFCIVCAWLPFVMDCMKKPGHFCSHCKRLQNP